MSEFRKILIIEDDRELNKGLCIALQKVGYVTFAAFDLKVARKYLESSLSNPALVLLDINLPDGSGLDFLAELKTQNSKLPVILLTSNDTDIDIVKGLEQGADDYITKPFSLAVLRARVAVQIRNTAKAENITSETSSSVDTDVKRSGYSSRGRTYQSESYFFDFDKMIFRSLTERSKEPMTADNQTDTNGEEQVKELLSKQVCDAQDGNSDRINVAVVGQTIELSRTEQRLLHILVANAGVTLKRSQLIDRIWTDGEEYVDENALSVAIKRLRDKLNAKDNIRTVYGLGYRWEDNSKH